jgi:hypothetical protein
VTLYITPVFYIYLDKVESWLLSLRKSRSAPIAPAITEPVL